MHAPAGRAMIEEALGRAARSGADSALAWLGSLAPGHGIWPTLARARVYRLAGMAPEALDAYRTIVFAAVPAETSVMLEFASLAVELFALDEARLVYRELLFRNDAASAGALGLWRLDCLAARSRARHLVGTDALRTGLVLAPADPALWLELGGFEVKRGCWDLGLRALRRTGSAFHGQSRLWRRLASCQAAREAWPAAAIAARRAIVLEPMGDGELWRLACEAFIRLKQPASARRAVAVLRLLQTRAVGDLVGRVELLFTERDRRALVHRLRHALVAEPGDEAAWLHLARAADALAKRKQARRIDRYLRLFPGIVGKRARLHVDGVSGQNAAHVVDSARVLLALGAADPAAMLAVASDGASRGDAGRALRWARAALCCRPAAPVMRAAAAMLRDVGHPELGVPGLCGAAAATPRDGEIRMALADAVGGVVRLENPIRHGEPLAAPRFIDCFCFNDEHRLLEARLELLYPHVDRFVLVEAPRTFTGAAKPLHFAENRDRYGRYLDKIVHVVADPPAFMSEPWARDFYQRDSILRGLNGYAAAEDFVVIADVDELWDPAVVTRFTGELAALRMRLAQGRVNHRPVFGKKVAYDAGAICRFRVLERVSPSVLRFETARQRSKADGDWIDDAGWHLTSVGDLGQVSGKLAAYAHQEPTKRRRFTLDAIGERLDRLASGIPDEDWLLFDADPRWPKAVRKLLRSTSTWQPPRDDLLSAALLDVTDAVDRSVGRRATGGRALLRAMRSGERPGTPEASPPGGTPAERLVDDPDDHAARMAAAAAAWDEARPFEAMRLIAAGLRRDPANVDMNAQRGFLQLRGGLVSEAMCSLRRTLLLAPGQAKVRRRLVICLDRLARYRDAERELDRLGACSPDQKTFDADMRARWRAEASSR